MTGNEQEVQRLTTYRHQPINGESNTPIGIGIVDASFRFGGSESFTPADATLAIAA